MEPSCGCRNRMNRISFASSVQELSELKIVLEQCEQCRAKDELLQMLLTRLTKELRTPCSQDKFEIFLKVNQEGNQKEFIEKQENTQKIGENPQKSPPEMNRCSVGSHYITISGETTTYQLLGESPVVIGASSPYNCTYLINNLESQIKLEIDPMTNQMTVHETQSNTANAAIKKAKSQLIQGECYLLGNSRLHIVECCKNKRLTMSITYNRQTENISLEPGGRQIIGREFLSFSDATMSREHATIYTTNNIWVIEMNPKSSSKLYRFLHRQTTLSQENPSYPITIKIGDEIRIKDTLINIVYI